MSLPEVLGRFAPDCSSLPQTVFNDPEVLDAELARIFTRSWLFLAHESEVAVSGDYVTRRMGRDQVIVSRGEDGQIRVMRNACTHRGTLLCKATLGNTSHFMCPYHAWTFDNTGRLRGVPEARPAYGTFDKSSRDLRRARTEVYQGLVFATWDDDAEPLADFLGDFAWYLDALVGGDGAAWEVAGPPQRYTIKANWKLSCENFGGDGYHVPYAHRAPIEGGLFGTEDTGTGGPSGRVVWTPQGHTARVGYHPAGSGIPAYHGYPDEQRAEFAAKAKPEVFAVLENSDVLHGNVFPNLSFIQTVITYTGDEVEPTAFLALRLALPISPTETEMLNFALVPRNAPDAWKQKSVLACVRTHGAAAGLFESDDVDNFTAVTFTGDGAIAARTDLDYSMGARLPRPEPDDWPGPGESVPHDHSEYTHRAYYTTWLRHLREDA
ncbi:aromatic ring-hydroxylating dioxygenase subunit alpha [Yinghuangia aomiensis]|uniref:Aromatic ring-hydroxylating dioxygenase subunit alpha n=1 Tax=Yinghuangia aomiensis TaxID=676205 RepID=A0ABP9I652_9ACTN